MRPWRPLVTSSVAERIVAGARSESEVWAATLREAPEWEPVFSPLAPAGDVYQAGTLSGNPLATAAGLSVLRRLRDPAVYDELERRSARLADGLAPFGRVQRVGAMLTLFAGRDEPVLRFEQFDTEPYGELFRGLLDRGIYIAPSQYECLFPSLAHGDEEIDATVEAVSSFYEGRNG